MSIQAQEKTDPSLEFIDIVGFYVKPERFKEVDEVFVPVNNINQDLKINDPNVKKIDFMEDADPKYQAETLTSVIEKWNALHADQKFSVSKELGFKPLIVTQLEKWERRDFIDAITSSCSLRAVQKTGGTTEFTLPKASVAQNLSELGSALVNTFPDSLKNALNLDTGPGANVARLRQEAHQYLMLAARRYAKEKKTRVRFTDLSPKEQSIAAFLVVTDHILSPLSLSSNQLNLSLNHYDKLHIGVSKGGNGTLNVHFLFPSAEPGKWIEERRTMGIPNNRKF
jgi:hypothetical protein